MINYEYEWSLLQRILKATKTYRIALGIDRYSKHAPGSSERNFHDAKLSVQDNLDKALKEYEEYILSLERKNVS